MCKQLFLIVVAVYWMSEIATAHRLSNDTDKFEVASAITAFSQDLYQKVANRTGNLVFSPFGAHSALSMAYLGAGGKTKESMELALELMDIPNPHLAYHDLLMDLKDVMGVDVKIASGLWVKPSALVRQEYKRRIKRQAHRTTTEALKFEAHRTCD
ncbi:hypothetical protein Btru_057122 [Bulinus truncatus]|nr:hypothetical protein Btru_057122 [Bulinus truncatus]